MGCIFTSPLYPLSSLKHLAGLLSYFWLERGIQVRGGSAPSHFFSPSTTSGVFHSHPPALVVILPYPLYPLPLAKGKGRKRMRGLAPPQSPPSFNSTPKRGVASEEGRQPLLKIPSPSPCKERGTQGVKLRCLKQAILNRTISENLARKHPD